MVFVTLSSPNDVRWGRMPCICPMSRTCSLIPESPLTSVPVLHSDPSSPKGLPLWQKLEQENVEDDCLPTNYRIMQHFGTCDV